MDQTTHEVRLANWTATIKECQSRPKGQTTKQWLEEHGISDKQYYYWLRKEHGISDKQYYYWLRKVRKNAFAEMSQNLPAPKVKQLPAPALVEIPAENVLPEAESIPAVTIRTKKSTITISSAVSEALMVKLVKAVSHAL